MDWTKLSLMFYGLDFIGHLLVATVLLKVRAFPFHFDGSYLLLRLDVKKEGSNVKPHG